MGTKRGSNGIQDGQRNVATFLAWSADVQDFKPYIHQGVLSVARVARECGLNRDVFYTNPDIRDVHWPALNQRLEEAGILKPRVAYPAAEVLRPRRTDPRDDARIKQIQEEAEAVKAENRELRRQLERFKGIDEILHTTGRLPW